MEKLCGFEIPRHLVIFSHKSIEEILRKIGFKSFFYPPYRKLCKSLFNASHAIENSMILTQMMHKILIYQKLLENLKKLL